MYFGYFWGDWTLIVLIPALIFTTWAQINVQTTYNKYSKMAMRHGFTGYEAARRILDANGLRHVSIEMISGHLTDHYDPRANVIRLSGTVYQSNSAAAVGVAAHEAGHAVQHAVGYFPIRVRTAIIPLTRFGSMMAMPLFIIGLFAAIEPLMLLGIAFFATATLFQLITLPVEFNASRRAVEALDGYGLFTEEEIRATRKVLGAAALTYVAALATSLLQLLRLFLLASNRRR